MSCQPGKPEPTFSLASTPVLLKVSYAMTEIFPVVRDGFTMEVSVDTKASGAVSTIASDQGCAR